MPPERLGQFGCPANMGVQFHFKLHCKAPRASPCRRCLFSWFPARNTATTKNMRARTLAFRPRMPPEHLCQFGCPLNMDAQSQATGPDQCTSGFSMPSVAVLVVPCQKQPQKHARTLLHVILDHASGASWSVRMSCQHGNANGFQHDRTKAP